MTLTLKVGKRYVRRDGEVSGPLIANPDTESSYPFMDPDTRAIFTASGDYWHDEISDEDLISEYKPAKPEWRVVIPCPSRDGARLMAAFLKEKNPGTKITVEKSS